MNNMQIMLLSPLIGGASGFGYGVYNKEYGNYGYNKNNPYVGYSEFVARGAALGAATGVAVAGLRWGANKSQFNEYSEATRNLLAMSGKSFWEI